MQLKRAFLWCVIGAASLAAQLGLWVLLLERFFGIEAEVFGTLGSVVLLCLPALVCAALMERGHWRGVMRVGVGWCLATLAWWLLVIWFMDWLRDFLHEQWMFRLMAIGLWWSLALPWMGLLSVRPMRRWRVVQRGAVICVAVFAAVCTVAVFTEDDADSLTWKAIGAAGILATLGTVVVPVLTRLEKIDRVAGVESTPLELWLRCPRCLREQTVTSGHARCAGCRLKFRIEIEEPRCPACGYLLHGLERPVCPECGAGLGAEEVGA